MVASIWLQPVGNEREILRDLIARLATEHCTVPFEPHLTVSTVGNPTPEAVQAAADYIATCRTLPLLVSRTALLHSPAVPLGAVTIGIENASDLRVFRETLCELTGANEPAEPHISLLYAIDSNQRPTEWASDSQKLQTIARECETRLAVSQFLLGGPSLVAPNGDWTNIARWTTVRRF